MQRRFFWLISFLLFCNIGQAQYSDLIFTHIGARKGLSDNHIRDIIQDHNGYIWIGTLVGLNRYDGSNCKVYLSDSADKHSLTGELIHQIFEDSKQRLWVCTSKGLNLYDEEHDRFIRFLNDPKDSASLANNLVTCMYEDRSGNLWIGNYDGISKLVVIGNEKLSVSFVNYKVNYKGSYNQWILCMCEDSHGYLWLGSFNQGVYRFDPAHGTSVNYLLIEGSPDNVGFRRKINAVFTDRDGVLWLLLHMNQGLAWYNEKEDRFVIEKLQVSSGQTHSKINTANDVFVDSTNTFWLATDYGLRLHNFKTGYDTGYIYSAEDKNGLSHSQIDNIFIDRDGGIWLGTSGMGIDYASRYFVPFRLINNERFPLLRQNIITSLGYSNNGRLFFSVSDNGGFVYDFTSDRVERLSAGIGNLYVNPRSTFFYSDKEGMYSIGKTSYPYNMNVVSGICFQGRISVTSDGNAWGRSPQGLTFYNRKTNECSVVVPKEAYNILMSNDYLLYVDDFDSVWLFSSKGLYHLVHENELIRCIPDYSFYNAVVRCDHKKNLWIASSDNLFYYDRRTGQTRRYDKQNGLTGTHLYSLLMDRDDNPWIATNKGLSVFRNDSKSFQNFGFEGELPEFNFLTYSCSDEHGRLFFGSSNGILIVDPGRYRRNKIVPDIVFTGFSLFNSPVLVSPEECPDHKTFYLEKQIGETEEIRLRYNENVFTIEFAALNYTSALQNEYAYYLEGLEKQWNYVGSRRFASYSGLQPGSYVFHVKGSNNCGVWNEKGRSLRLIIMPPFWQTWWFRSLLILLILAVIAIVFRLRIHAIKKQKEELERQVKDRTHEIEMQKEEILVQRDDISDKADKLRLLNATKDKFFSIIAHDLKNPFSVIMGFADLMTEGIDRNSREDKLKYLDAIKVSSTKAFSLLENLLQWARSQTSSIQVSATVFDLHTLVWDTFQLLRVNADNKKIALINSVAQNTFVETDRNMLSTVIRNLVSNAIKFSDLEKTITVSAVVVDECIEIRIKDQGMGMSKETINKLFKIDQHLTQPGTAGETGTGLGLIICNEFVQKNNGTIRVDSKPGEGSTFIISLPFNKGDAVTTFVKPVSDSGQVPNLVQEVEDTVTPSDCSILLIDDNVDIRNTIREHLKEKYAILEAENGKAGFGIATDQIPDLIVCDWMMPEMDGIQFCKLIKEDERTSHIPCILLTAKNADEDEREGLITGADDYMTKPFNAQNLVIKIRNILESKKKLRDKFARDMGVKVKFDSGNETDNLFVEKVTTIIEKNLADPDFGHEQLAREMGMGKTNLYKKMNALTGLSVHLYIRNIRLHKATEKFRQGEKNIAQVAYEVGFNDHTYFTRCFTDLFKKNPTEFIAGLK